MPAGWGYGTHSRDSETQHWVLTELMELGTDQLEKEGPERWPVAPQIQPPSGL